MGEFVKLENYALAEGQSNSSVPRDKPSFVKNDTIINFKTESHKLKKKTPPVVFFKTYKFFIYFKLNYECRK